MLGKTAARHTSAEFVAFLADIVVDQPAAIEMHVIADTWLGEKTRWIELFRSAHKTK